MGWRLSLPKFKSDEQSLMLLQTAWASQLDPLLKNPMSNGNLLKNVALASGTNVVNHLLGRKLQGWTITRIRSAASIFDTQDTNPTPALTLTLTSSAAVTIDLLVF